MRVFVSKVLNITSILKEIGMLLIFMALLFLPFVLPKQIFAQVLPVMISIGIDSDFSINEFYNEISVLKPMYIFSNPYLEETKLNSLRNNKIHNLSPETKTILHLTCCSVFDQKKLDSPYARSTFSTQNTQQQFDKLKSQIKKNFLGNTSGKSIYFIIKKEGNSKMWLEEGQAHLADPASPEFQDLLYTSIRDKIIREHYDGVYLDLMLQGFMDGFYSDVPQINGKPVTVEQWTEKLISLSNSLQNKRKNDSDSRMRSALIFTNSVGGGKYTKDVKEYNIALQTQGVQIENPFKDYKSMSVDDWLQTLTLIKDITGLKGNKMKGWINYHYPDEMTNRGQCSDKSLFVYSSYLLGNQSPDFAFYFLCKMKLNGKNVREVPSIDLVKVKLGVPVGDYSELDSGLYLREYTNGIVFVNPAKKTVRYKPDINLKDAYSSTLYPKNKDFTLTPSSGLILLRTSLTISADIVNDGNKVGDEVNNFDREYLIKEFGKTGNGIKSDINKDGKVDIFDYNALIGKWAE